jgi:hypothetical protein
MDLDSVVVVSGERPQPKGFSGWMQRKMEESQRLAEERRAARGGTGAGGSSPGGANRKGNRGGYQTKVDQTASDGADVTAGASKSTGTSGRPGKRSGSRPTTNRSSKSTAAAPKPANGHAADGVERSTDEGVSVGANGAAPLPVPRKSRPGRKPADGPTE